MFLARYLVYADTALHRYLVYVDTALQHGEFPRMGTLHRLGCGRLRGFEASGCRLARLAHRGRYQAVLLACCKSRLQWSIYAVEVCGSNIPLT